MKDTTKRKAMAIGSTVTAAIVNPLVLLAGPKKLYHKAEESIDFIASIIDICNNPEVIDAEFSVVEES